MQIARQTSVCIRRVMRKPEIQRIVRSSHHIRRHALRGTVLSLIPSEVTDVIIHHAQVDVGEILRVATDSVSTSAVGTVLSIALTTLKTI
jgi:hypothetical protein